MSYCFPKSSRLLKGPEFRQVHADGQRLSGQTVQVLYLPNGLTRTRVGLAVGKKHGKAVRRNQLKRWLREAVRRNLASLGTGLDVIILPRLHAKSPSFRAIVSDFLRLGQLLRNKRDIELRQESYPGHT